MNILKITITSIILFFLSIFLYFLSFLPNETKSLENNFFTKKESWIYELSLSWKSNNVTQNDIKTNVYYKEQLTSFDTIYFKLKSKDAYKKTINWNNIDIDIKEGIFFLNIPDIINNYSIKSDSFIIEPKWTWRFYVDNRDNKSIKILSVDWILDLELINLENSQKVTSIRLYPHMYFSFNANRNKLVKNADLLRLSMIFNVSYYENIFLSWNIENFISLFYKDDDKEARDFYKNVLDLSVNSENNKFTSVRDFILENDYNLPWSLYLTKYFKFLLNDTKKVVYYQNNILNNLNKLVFTSSENEINSLVQNIKIDLDDLKKLDSDWYSEVVKVIYHYYDWLLNTNDIKIIDNIYALANINSYIENSVIKVSNVKSSLLLNKLYKIIEEWDKEKVKINFVLLDYLDSYFREKSIKVDENTNSLIFKNKWNIITELDYLSFFIKNVLLVDSDFSTLKDAKDTLSLLKNYFSINNSLLLATDNKKESLIIEYYTLLNKLLNEIKDNYFEDNLDDRGLLILKNENKILPNEELVKLDKVLKLFFEFHTKNKSYISTKNLVYNKLYVSAEEKYNKYFLALSNYPTYVLTYDKTKNTLLTSNTVLDTVEEIELSEKNINNFLWQFNWIDTSNTKINIINNDYYKIENLNINWNNFSFQIYPKNWNRIDNIYKNWESLKESYEFDSLKEDLEMLYSNALVEDKPKYDYKNFFLNTFTEKIQKSSEEFVYSSGTIQEDKSIVIFKRDKLLWERWDFTILKWLLDIWYNNISVELDWNKYDIKVEWWKYIYSNDKNLIWDFYSNYYFSSSDHYFDSIRIKLSNVNYNNKLTWIFSDNYINIDESINVLDFKDTFPKIIDTILGTKEVYTIINDTFILKDLKISYKESNISYNFSNDNKSITIVCSWWKVNKIAVDWNNILNNKIIDYTDLTKYLKLLN